MAKCYAKSYVLFLMLLIAGSTATAQQPEKKSTYTPVQKFKPPVVKSYLDKYSGTVTITPEEGKRIIVGELRLEDAKKNTYKISSYQMAYKRQGVTEDEETGETKPASDMVAQRFTETPLPQIWKSNIVEQLHKGEELYFFDIIAYDKQNRLFFAPELKIIIQ
jgi:hypothetical protein